MVLVFLLKQKILFYFEKSKLIHICKDFIKLKYISFVTLNMASKFIHTFEIKNRATIGLN